MPHDPASFAEVGHERGVFDEVDGGGKWDWTVGGRLAVNKLRISFSYCGTDAGRDALVASLLLDF